MADQDPQEFVYVRSSGDGSDVLPGRVTRQAYDQIWKGKGFVIVPDDEAELAGSPATQAEVQAAEPVKASTKKGA
jgi:hypothetical protein